MTTVYLDTSVAMNESFLRSSYFDAFLKACAILQFTVVLPEIVFDEMKGNFPKKLQEKLFIFQKANKEIKKLIDVDVATVSLLESVKSYGEWLVELIDENGIILAPYPDVSAKEIVDKSYEAKKPFKDSGEGHKDYIVWKTILSHIASNEASPPNIFLTNNTKDFCDVDKDGAAVLHSELAEQIQKPAHRPKVYTSIKSAFDSELSPNLEGITVDDIPDLGIHDIDSMAEKLLLDDLPGRQLYGLEGVPFGNEISISSISTHSIGSVTLKKVDDEVIVTVTGEVDLEVDGFIDKFEYYSNDDDKPNMYVVDGDWNEHVMMVSSSVETSFELIMFYSTHNSEVTGYVISLPQEIKDEWPYK
ncbi:PIN domain-containing protein [Sphingobium cupriresistens]|uniref:PIN domain-containing protein n=1 Tax=Sphingobium cupriresistens TaxID=1132417 RepID=UPI003BADF654